MMTTIQQEIQETVKQKEEKDHEIKFGLNKHIFLEILEKIRVRLAIIKAYKEIVIKTLLDVRKKSLEKIENFFQSIILNINKINLEYSISRKIKSFLIIREILAKRQRAINLIKSNIQIYLVKKKFKEIYPKVKDCYSIYSSVSKVQDMDILLYNDIRNVQKGRTIPMKFCPLRKTYVFDVFKNKYRYNKIIRFNFVINNNVVVEPGYVSRNIDGKFVNEINFADIDQRIEKNKKTIYNKKTYTPTKALMNKFQEKEIILFHTIKQKSVDEENLNKTSCNSVSDEDEYGNLRANRGVNCHSTTQLLNVQKESQSYENVANPSIGKNPIPRKRFTTECGLEVLKPILKNSMKLPTSAKKNSERRVSFGTVQFSF